MATAINKRRWITRQLSGLSARSVTCAAVWFLRKAVRVITLAGRRVQRAVRVNFSVSAHLLHPSVRESSLSLGKVSRKRETRIYESRNSRSIPKNCAGKSEKVARSLPLLRLSLSFEGKSELILAKSDWRRMVTCKHNLAFLLQMGERGGCTCGYLAGRPWKRWFELTL